VRAIATRVDERRATRLLTPESRVAAETAIVLRPGAWPVIPGTGGARKARVALPGRGKSGGARLIYFHSVADVLIVLFDVYAKNAQEDLSHADKRALKAAITEIRAAAGAHRPG